MNAERVGRKAPPRPISPVPLGDLQGFTQKPSWPGSTSLGRGTPFPAPSKRKLAAPSPCLTSFLWERHGSVSQAALEPFPGSRTEAPCGIPGVGTASLFRSGSRGRPAAGSAFELLGDLPAVGPGEAPGLRGSSSPLNMRGGRCRELCAAGASPRTQARTGEDRDKGPRAARHSSSVKHGLTLLTAIHHGMLGSLRGLTRQRLSPKSGAQRASPCWIRWR